MKKNRGKLGRFILKRFQRKARSQSLPLPQRKLSQRKLSQSRFSNQHAELRTPVTSKSRPHLAVRTLKISEMRKKFKADLQKPLNTPEPISPEQIESPQKSSTLPALTSLQVPVQNVEVQKENTHENTLENKGSQNLLSSDLIRPNDRLNDSIKGFLLDQRSEHTRKAYGKDLKRFLMFLSVRNFKQGPSDLNRTVLIAYKESLLTEGLEHTTVDRHLATLRSFFNWLVDDGIIFRSPADGVRFLNPKRLSRTIGFSDEEVKKLLSKPDLHTRTGSLHYAILMILFYCGLRRSEVCNLRTTNLGTERGQRVLRLRGKGNAERIVVVIPAVWNAIKHYFFILRRDITRDDHLFSPIRNNRTNITKKPLDTSMIFYIVTKYAKLAGIANRVSPHSCRATAISNARDHHVPDRAIQEFAGWASPDMITRYDKRKSSIENSAAHAISYGAENRDIPQSPELDIPLREPKEVAPPPALALEHPYLNQDASLPQIESK